MANVIKGDLVKMALEGKFDVIVHGCNCFHTMGAGIARQLKDAIPSVYAADLRTAYGDSRKLGKFSTAEVLVGPKATPLVIVNAYTQFQPSPPVNYLAVSKIFEDISLLYANCKIGIPRIGSGLAMGNAVVIEDIIFNAAAGLKDLTIVDYDPEV